MNKQTPASLLIVEDDLDIADMLKAYFHVQGYDVSTVHFGEDGVKACVETPPDLVILDIRLPDIDGFEVARQLKANRKTQDIPVIFLTEKRQREDRLQGLSLSADDYVTKPFDIQELRLRVRNTLLRHQRGHLMNAITGLPERQLMTEEIEKRLILGDFMLAMVTIKNLQAFRDVYGFIASDDLLRAIVIMLREGLTHAAGEHTYLAQLDAETFVLIYPILDDQSMLDRIQNRVMKSFDYFYNERDREAGRFEHQLGLGIYQWMIRSGSMNLQSILMEMDKVRLG